MKRLVIATNNEGKAREIKAILGSYYAEILSLKDLGAAIEVAEDGATFEENAVKKALEVYKAARCDTLADDSGLCVEALGGRPGVYSARYAGENASDEENNAKLLFEMRDKMDRRAKYVCVMALADEYGVLTAYGESHGTIAHAPCGEGGFGYDPLFYSAEFGTTYACLPSKIKNSISHRAKALEALKKKLTERRER